MGLDESGFPQPTGEFEELTADSVVLALGQDVDRSLLDGVRGGHRRRRRRRRAGHDDRVRPASSPAATWCRSERYGHVGGRTRQARRAAHRRVAARGGPEPPASGPQSRASTRLNPWYYSDAPQPPSGRPGGAPDASHASTRSCRASTKRPRCSRRAGVCRAETASSATTAMACVRTTRCIKLGAGPAVSRSIWTTARDAASAPPSAPAARSRWCPRTEWAGCPSRALDASRRLPPIRWGTRVLPVAPGEPGRRCAACRA